MMNPTSRHGGLFREALEYAKSKLESGVIPSPNKISDKYDIDIMKASKLIQVAQMQLNAEKDSIQPMCDKDTELALVALDPFSVCLEVFYTVGQEKFIELISIFGGLCVNFPTHGEIRDSLKRVSLYRRLNSGEDAESLAKEYKISVENVLRIGAEVQKSINFGLTTNESKK